MSAPVLEGQASFALRGHNPDVLTCIANLSNDEVFTPPELANQMLDTVADAWADAHDGASIWQNPDVTFLDPFTKSGVFLREITARLTDGLADVIPDLQERVDHILTKQVYGIGITQLTALLARRSVYCSKDATGPHSIAKSFDRDWGNIWFERTEHTWAGDKCAYCGAGKSGYGRGDELETHAYAFIHTTDPRALLARMFGADVQFDVIIGNPPYQLSDGGAGTSAKPIYQNFIRQAQMMEPRFLSMITPARWMAGGKGLDEFRAHMLGDRRVRNLVDFLNASDAFPGVDVAGGIAYFLWDRDHGGECAVTTIHGGIVRGPFSRRLDEFDVFVRQAQAVAILHRVWPEGPAVASTLAAVVSSRMAFGFASNDRGSGVKGALRDPVELVSSATTETHREWVERSEVATNVAWVDLWKSTFGGAAPAGGRPDKDGRYYGLSSIRVLPPGVITTESYLVAGAFGSRREADNLDRYLRTKFVRFLVSLRAVTQHVTKGSFSFVPLQDFSRPWTDADLYEKYGITDDEIAFIESMVRPMEPTDVEA
ncbi:Eco57I restriction-modification methylase domain-containing protein [Microbacterium lacticum]